MLLYSKSTTNLSVIWYHTCISYKAFYFCGPGGICWCGCGKIFKKRTRAVWECAERKAIVRRVCGCAKIGCTQIPWEFGKQEYALVHQLCNTYIIAMSISHVIIAGPVHNCCKLENDFLMISRQMKMVWIFQIFHLSFSPKQITKVCRKP